MFSIAEVHARARTRAGYNDKIGKYGLGKGLLRVLVSQIYFARES